MAVLTAKRTLLGAETNQTHPFGGDRGGDIGGGDGDVEGRGCRRGGSDGEGVAEAVEARAGGDRIDRGWIYLKAFTSAPTQYVEYLAEFWYTAKALEGSRIWVFTPTGGVRVITTFRNAIEAYYSDEYVESPSHAIDKPWFAELGYNGEIGLNEKSRERVIPYPRFIYLLLEYMAPEYANESLTINPTQVFSVNNWALKPNQPEEPPFIEHMLVVYNKAVHNVPNAPKPSSNAERVPQGTKPGAKPGHKKHSTSSTQPSMSSSEITKGGSSKRPTGSKLAT
ncbi:hypothetical protein Tco_0930956 [Tanacetum coccineum]